MNLPFWRNAVRQLKREHFRDDLSSLLQGGFQNPLRAGTSVGNTPGLATRGRRVCPIGGGCSACEYGACITHHLRQVPLPERR